MTADTMATWKPTTREEAEAFFVEFYRGKHHIPGGEVKHSDKHGWCVNHYGDLSTWDFDMLTRLVFLAHDRCVRVSIDSSGPRMVRIIVHQRRYREGDISRRHPTLEQAVEAWRKRNPKTLEIA